MTEPILVVDGLSAENEEICAILDRHEFPNQSLHSLEDLTLALSKIACHAVILDLDSLPVDNRFLRNLCKAKPELCVIATSRRSFHPELEEAMRIHISACLGKPLDEEELIYWLKSMCGGGPRARASPREE